MKIQRLIYRISFFSKDAERVEQLIPDLENKFVFKPDLGLTYSTYYVDLTSEDLAVFKLAKNEHMSLHTCVLFKDGDKITLFDIL